MSKNKTINATKYSNPINITQYFLSITDPRLEHNKEHLLIDIVMLCICGVIAGCESWVAIAEFGEEKKSWFGKFLKLPGGIPSHDTIGRVFSLVKPEEFQASFALWMKSVAAITNGDVIAVDGKTNRRTFGKSVKPLHLVSAFATANGVALGQVATNQKSNEITAIPELLKLLDIRGCIMTTDAMGCQSDIAADIVQRGGDYLLAVKGNQGLLYRDIKACFARLSDDPVLQSLHTSNTTENSGHGRIEKRVCDVLSGTYVIDQLHHKNNWVELNTIVRVTATRTSKVTGEITIAKRYYICSLKNPTAERIQAAVRAHWSVENGLHWTLDMAMREDESRIRTDHAPANMAVLRHIALNIIRADKSRKVGIRLSQQKASWSERYLEKLLGW